MVFVLNEHATLAASSNYKLASICPLSFVQPDFSLGLHRINIESALAHVSSAEKPAISFHDSASHGVSERLVWSWGPCTELSWFNPRGKQRRLSSCNCGKPGWFWLVVILSSACATQNILVHVIAMEEVGCREEQCPVTLLEARVKCYKDDEFPAIRQHFYRQYIIMVTSIEHVGVPYW